MVRLKRRTLRAATSSTVSKEVAHFPQGASYVLWMYHTQDGCRHLERRLLRGKSPDDVACPFEQGTMDDASLLIANFGGTSGPERFRTTSSHLRKWWPFLDLRTFGANTGAVGLPDLNKYRSVREHLKLPLHRHCKNVIFDHCLCVPTPHIAAFKSTFSGVHLVR